jgi:aerobic carbon-monoxide dehydrogenase medium subunit
MFPADFAYARARSLDEALDLLDEAAADGEEAKLIAGGQSLLPMMKLRLAAPQVLIDIADLKELGTGGWAVQGSGFNVLMGALTTYRQLSRGHFYSEGLPVDHGGHQGRVGIVPALTDALAVLADPQVRARGTIGGAVAHGDPAADLPAVLLALNAEVTIASRAGRHEQIRPRPQGAAGYGVRVNDAQNVGTREIALDDFLQGIYTTDLADDEIITHIRIRTPGARGSAYEKFPHPASHLPLAGVCAVVRLRDGLIDSAEVAVTGISPRPYRARATEQFLKGAAPAPGSLAAAAAQVTMDLHPQGTPHATVTAGSPGTGTGKRSGQVTLLGDHHASADYRAHLAEVLTRRALARAIARAGTA